MQCLKGGNMTEAEVNDCKERIHKGMKMVMDKAEKIGKEEEFSMEEVGMMADIVKDMSESLKNLAKTHHLLAEHSIKKY